MFVRKKKNPSGIISVQIIDKSSGKYRVIKTLGSSSDSETVELLFRQGRKWIARHTKGEDLFEQHTAQAEEEEHVDRLLSNVENILLNGTELILNRVYDKIGFNQIEDDILRYLAIARLGQPLSKSGTVAYLKSYFNEDLKLEKVYRYLDKLYNTQQEQIQRISVNHTREIMGNRIGLLFYDVTTLYFATDKKDELREKGFSKDGKHGHSQVVLGLLVSKDGYPLSYSLFNGSQYEGRTMLPVLEDFVQRFELKDFVIVADSGLMNRSNLALLEQRHYKYIIGARIKSESKAVKAWILSLKKEEGVFNEYQKTGNRLIIGYSQRRAQKDRYNREKGVMRLEKDFKGGKIAKDKVNKRGYNKFLDIAENIGVEINYKKIEEDEKWDGLKGYSTNTTLSPEEVYHQYNGLWIIEKAFRVTKGTLQIRPMFHFTPRRIEAHVSICFVAYKMYKELERILKQEGFAMSVDKVLAIAKTIGTVKIRLPESGKTIKRNMFLTPEHKSIERLFEDDFWANLI